MEGISLATVFLPQVKGLCALLSQALLPVPSVLRLHLNRGSQRGSSLAFPLPLKKLETRGGT